MAPKIWIAVAVIIMLAGVLILLDYRGLTSAWTSSVERWWRGGPGRRRLNVKVPSFRFMGALLILVGAVLLADVR
jgi:ABC-type phosphate transport system auxiliary subunit